MFSQPKSKDSKLSEQQKINFKKMCEDFLKAENLKSDTAKAKCLTTAEGYQLRDLLIDPVFGLDYTLLLCKEYPGVLSPGSWAEMAKTSIEHARLILNNPNLAVVLWHKGFLCTIADGRPEHATFILEKFKNQLDEDSKKMVEFFSTESVRSHHQLK